MKPVRAKAVMFARVLMVAFHFPPQSGSSGILRTLNFVKYLPLAGWQPCVLSAHARAYVEQSDNLLRSIPPEVPVIRAFALDAARHLALAGKYPRLFALPDRWASWWLGGVVQGLRAIRRLKPAVIWSTYPIATAHWIGGTLARWSGLPWVVDFRDPMVSQDAPSNMWQRKIWLRIERNAAVHAAACIFTTARAAQAFERRYPEAANKCHVIENGYDEAAFEGLKPNRFGAEPDSLLLLHSGLIYPRDRDPSTFFSAVRSLMDHGLLDPSRVCIRFRAPQHSAEILQCSREHGLEAQVEIAPPIPYRDALAEMMAADLLLVFQGSNFNAQIPAKIYEYLRAVRPLLAVLDPQGDTAKQLSRFKGIRLADIAQPVDVKDRLLEWLEGRELESEAIALENNRVAVTAMYSRKVQAESLARVLDEICGLSKSA